METKVVKYIKLAKYDRPGYGWNSWETVYIHKFEDTDGNIYVWKTTKMFIKEVVDEKGICSYETAPVGSTVEIKFSVKGESEYHGEKQTVIQRVKIINIIDRALTREEKLEIKKQEQLESLVGDDFIWRNMPYRQYKNHYADCEILAGSYKDTDAAGRPADRTVDVIIREGRLKNSGVRGQCYYYWVFKNEAEDFVRTIKAVSFENAYNRVVKENPGSEWNLDHFEIVSHGW